jgi:omega-amidase
MVGHSYDKRHLFRFAGENDHYSAGTKRLVVEWRGWRLLLQICFDLRFPVFARNRGDYDAILYVANWPEARRYPWSQLLIARAIENQCYVAGVNRVGMDGKGNHYTGRFRDDRSAWSGDRECIPRSGRVHDRCVGCDRFGRLQGEVPGRVGC